MTNNGVFEDNLSTWENVIYGVYIYIYIYIYINAIEIKVKVVNYAEIVQKTIACLLRAQSCTSTNCTN